MINIGCTQIFVTVQTSDSVVPTDGAESECPLPEIERWFYTIPLRLRSLFRRSQVEQELDEELSYHLDRQIEEHIAKGMTPEDARCAAMRALGGIEQRKDECRLIGAGLMMRSFMRLQHTNSGFNPENLGI